MAASLVLALLPIPVLASVGGDLPVPITAGAATALILIFARLISQHDRDRLPVGQEWSSLVRVLRAELTDARDGERRCGDRINDIETRHSGELLDLRSQLHDAQAELREVRAEVQALRGRKS